MNAIEVKDLCVAYKRVKRVSLKKQLFSLPLNKSNLIEAVNGVSFQVNKGDIVGIIGRNGSGKSTLLRTLAGIFSPNSGSIDIFGNTIALLSIGVGFQNELSGMENIFLSGMLLGYNKEQINAKLDEIIDFSELGSFINMPVKTYSSGMYSKLAFSITVALEPDIMLVDEVLSVGDAKFKEKSYNKMQEIIADSTRTVIIVSHSLEMLKKLCDKVIWLNEGKIIMEGIPQDIISAYEKA